MKKYGWYKTFLFCLLCLLWLAGCGREETSSGEDPSGEEKTEVLAADWKTNGFAISEEVREEQALWASEHVRWQHEGVRNAISTESIYEILEPGIYGGRIYRLYQLTQQEGNDSSRYLIEIYDTSVMQAAIAEIDNEKLGVGNGFIADMGLIAQDSYVFRVLEYEREETAQGIRFKSVKDNMVYSDLGMNTEKADVLQTLSEEYGSDIVAQECFCDGAGNSYVRAGSSAEHAYHDLYILDRKGKLLMKQTGDRYDEIRAPLRMEQGELVFPIYNNKEKSTKIVWFDPDNKEAHTLALLENDLGKQIYGIQGNDIYYESFDGIVKWNIVSGDRVLIYSFDGNGVSKKYNTMLVFREGQAPILRMYATVNDEEEDWLVVLSEQETEPPEATRIVSLNGTSANVRDCVYVATRRNPDLNFTYEDGTEADENDFRTRVMAEIAAGGGPDILYVSLEDMRQLKNQGALADLRTILSEDILDQILPGIVALGTVDGTFTGLAPEMDVRTMITLKSIWDQSTWKPEDILELMDTGRFTSVFCQGSDTFAPLALLKLMTEFGLQDSSLVDWETGESYFESELFLEILELAKNYGDNPIRTDTWLGEGGSLGDITGINIGTINQFYEKYKDDYYFVGMPTSGSSGNYVTSEGVLVVNRNAPNPAAVSAYLECLLRDEIQYAARTLNSHESIRRVSPDEAEIVEIPFVGFEGEIRAYWHQYTLTIKEDGNTTLSDYADLLESCVPCPENYDVILSIVLEEAQSYLTGDKSAKDVASVINNRSQMYLDERN